MKEKIFITGASRGIGRAIALQLARPNRQLLLHYNQNHDLAQQVALACQEKKAETKLLQADFAKDEDMKRILEEIPSVDILINNAGVSSYGQIQDISLEEWKRIFQINVHSPFQITQKLIPYMIRNKYGRIVNISSIWGQVGSSCESLYSATKGAILSFTKSLAKELAPSGITVNCLCPGIVDTDMMKIFREEEKEELKKEVPIGRFLQAEEVAYWVEYLVSKQASAFTGQVISPNGGQIIF